MSEIGASRAQVDGFLCSILRGESASWPAAACAEFEDEFPDRASHHGVEALIYGVAESKRELDSWPERIREELLKASRSAAAQDMLRAHTLEKILTELGQQGIRVLIIKGAALAITLYEHSRLRTRSDTDLFIHFGDIERIRSSLLNLGLEILTPVYKNHQFVCAKKTTHGSLHFDIHWRIQNAPQFARVISFDEAWAKSVPVPGVAGARMLNGVDALLLACLHLKGSQHHDEDRLIWLYDIHLLASSLSDGSWGEFERVVVEKGVQAACLDGLLKSRDSFSTEIPPGFIPALEASHPVQGRFASSNLALLIDDFRCLPGLRSKSNLLKELFLPAPSALMARYEKGNRAWLPILYIRQVVGGVAKRLSLH